MMNQSPIETALSRAMIRWSLSKTMQVAETAGSVLYRVEQNGKDLAALKLARPGSDTDAVSDALLAWYGGEGAVTVFDAFDGAMFMEWIEGPTLATLPADGRDAEAAEALASIAQRLLFPREDPPEGLVSLRSHFAPLFAPPSPDWPRMGRDLLARSVGIAHKLFDKPSAIMPLHGNLVHESIVLSPRGWLAANPLGLLGDPTFELAPAFLTPVDQHKLVAEPMRVTMLADKFTGALGLNRKRLLGFAAINAALSARRDLAAGQPIAHQLGVLPHLLAAYDQAEGR